MDKPINGDRYVRTLSHYLRSNQRRLLPPTPPPNSDPSAASSVSSTAAANARSFVTPADSMAAAYSGMVTSLWNATSSVVSAITPSSMISGNLGSPSQDQQDTYTGSWDGTGSVLPDSSPNERQLYLSAQLRSPIFPLDLYYLLYLLERFEQVGIELEGWEGATPRTVGTSTPRVNFPAASAPGDATTSRSLCPPPAAAPVTSTRPQSVRSFSSTAVSTLTLITGWKQWSTAASLNSSNLTVTDDIHFIHKFLKHVPSLRLVAKIPPGNQFQGKGRIEGFNADAILTLFSHEQTLEMNDETGSSHARPLLLLPLAVTFPALTHLELHKIPPDCIEGWETLMLQLKSLVVVQSGIQDAHDILIAAVINSERRRRQRISKERNRAVLIKEEQQEALKDAALTSQELEGLTIEDPAGVKSEADSRVAKESEEDDATILSMLKMWPALQHLSLSDNSLPALTHGNTFLYTQSITSLDLSHNLLLAPPSGLIHLHNLSHLNLSYNMISGVQSIYQILGNIATLDLRGNRLESLSGLERLWNLEKVDVRENHLDEAAEVGRLAALPGIREVWSENNPFCAIQPKYRLQILAVFKANGHDLLLDGTFASFTERRSLSNMSPSSFSTTISSVNNVANIPAASAPIATFAKELASDNQYMSRPQSATEEALNAATKTLPGTNVQSPPGKLVKKKLLKAHKRVKRVVNLDSDHEGEGLAIIDEDVKGLESLQGNEESAVGSRAKNFEGTLGPPAAIRDKKKKKDGKASGLKSKDSLTAQGSNSKSNHDAGSENGDENGVSQDPSKEGKTKKRVSRKKSPGVANVSFASDDQDPTIDHSLCRDDHHVHRHRFAQLEKTMASKKLERAATFSTTDTVGSSSTASTSAHQRHPPSKGILKRNSMIVTNNGAVSPRLRPSSPIGSFSSDDGGADGYRRRIEAMRNEAGKNWLMVLAEMDRDSSQGHERGAS
ncbi:hypothetical protein BGZ51_003960 [Haplosporangium sp. Z 767]|nr:hypothetical protein BGZ50_007847 [Haplosporangium sp. Z 11]KAF9193211.1 hypothetical protein BGZ51_003960 [Haplosporangium sp. Z 767]